MISTEKAFDLLPDVIEIAEKLEIKEYIAKNQGKTNDAQEAGFALIFHIAKNMGKVKENVIALLAKVEDKTEKEIAEQPVGKTYNDFKALMQSEGVMDFFSSAMG